MKNLFLVILLLKMYMAVGQNSISRAEELSDMGAYGTRVVVRKPIKNTVQGHQYYENENKLASVYINGKKLRRAYVRYNSLNDEIEVTEVFNILKKENIKVVLDKGYVYKMLDFEGTKQFFIFLKEGKNSLVMKVEKRIKQGENAIDAYKQSTNAKYIEKRRYFILTSEGDLLRVKLKQKDVLKVLGDKKNEIKKYVSSKGLNYKKENDLIRIVSYYNTL
ncbi:hypothetical protein [Aquimarina algiphila]|uniref:hypothetical protein n=1 Tax=Aquimarina algiphila TaxID=2047982 RepID=UPI00233109B8|nr:hypothetical protein [Aquimarina algiphila]